ncbi:AAA family ATPase [Luteolibacter arcticus]|uniref:AAA family ATPase n=1 Tax=Luteolibacter arcticus TaxID=1581411 RepID=A0ABT3GC55_9BACT|nr:AAA family ATPase [Luteolibacter arcticus]MCW1921206.1 AAA family ATPase [Luteolibacter arcticus]
MNVSIRNYKSIRSLDFESRRVNVIIGEPNCGKTNVIEALSLFHLSSVKNAQTCLRARLPSEMFWDQDIGSPISVIVGGLKLEVGLHSGAVVAVGKQSGPHLSIQGEYAEGTSLIKFSLILPGDLAKFPKMSGGEGVTAKWPQSICPYWFLPMEDFSSHEVVRLAPPFGENLATLLSSRKEARQTAAEVFDRGGFNLEVRPRENRLGLTKSFDGITVSIPFSSSSETLRRILFYRLALETNSDSVLLLDEPEANTFPLFTKLFAEQMAADDRGNTFFLTTHSPYLLGSLIEKTPKEDLAIILCHMENFETKARVLEQTEVQELLDLGPDAFFNLDRLGEG